MFGCVQKKRDQLGAVCMSKDLLGTAKIFLTYVPMILNLFSRELVPSQTLRLCMINSQSYPQVDY
jgi:hypothetical protein